MSNGFQVDGTVCHLSFSLESINVLRSYIVWKFKSKRMSTLRYIQKSKQWQNVWGLISYCKEIHYFFKSKEKFLSIKRGDVMEHILICFNKSLLNPGKYNCNFINFLVIQYVFCVYYTLFMFFDFHIILGNHQFLTEYTFQMRVIIWFLFCYGFCFCEFYINTFNLQTKISPILRFQFYIGFNFIPFFSTFIFNR